MAIRPSEFQKTGMENPKSPTISSAERRISHVKLGSKTIEHINAGAHEETNDPLTRTFWCPSLPTVLVVQYFS